MLKKGKKVVALFVLFAILAGVIIVWFVVQARWGGFDELRVLRALAKTVNQETVAVRLQADLSGSREKLLGGEAPTSLQIDWKAEGLAPGGMFGSSSSRVSDQQGTVRVEGSLENGDTNAAFEYRQIGDQRYYRFTEIPTLPDVGPLKLFSGVLDTLTGQWILIGGEDQTMFASLLPTTFSFSACEKSDAQAARAYLRSRILKGPALFDTVRSSSSLEGAGEDIQSYDLSLRRSAVEDALQGMQAAAGCPSKGGKMLSDTTAVDRLTIFLGKSGQVRGLDVAFHDTGKENSTSEFHLFLSDFGVKPTVEIPEEARTIREILMESLSEVFSGFGGGGGLVPLRGR